jgi:hypothetical protein
MQQTDSMLKVISVVKRIITEFSGAVTEGRKIVVITKIFLRLMKENGN